MKVVILGAGGQGQVVAAIIRAARLAGGEVELAGFLDDRRELADTLVADAPVLGTLADLDAVRAQAFIVAIGDNTRRAQVARQGYRTGRPMLSVRHPHASIDPDTAIGDGTMISAGAVVVTGARIGRGVILNTGCTVDHHTSVGDFVHLAPGVHVGGEAAIGELTLVGIGAVVLPRCRIGTRCTVAAGAVVTRDLPDGSVVAGVPARPISPSQAPADAQPLLVNR